MMQIINTKLAGVHVVETSRHQDNRGSFARFFCQETLKPVLENKHIVQINHSVTAKKGTIRGMHFQIPPHAEMKLVRCLKGRVFDVVLDLRAGSKTFLQWHGEELTPENNKMLVIPEGCAHGFQTLENDTELLYLHTAYYQPKSESGVLYDDVAFNIQWPLNCAGLSERDTKHPKIEMNYQGIKL
jgi:dTDP-4-dehydrorhamnose 3,5-epimerase